tara:strand:+ start:5880 stop:7004 length:1125 start_codon:yes stop_codon:yes gene_type:complete
MESIIYILIIILIIYIIFNTYNICENFDNFKTEKQYDLKRDIEMKDSNRITTIDEPIEYKYLTFVVHVDVDNKYDYHIIKTYKEVLKRQPKSQELNNERQKLLTGERTIDFLYIILYNSIEYENEMMMQMNTIDRGLENAIFKEKLYKFIENLYKRYVSKDKIISRKLLSYLADIYRHLYFDTYLFIGFLTMKNYKTFEKDLLSQPIVNKYILKELFDKYTDMERITLFGNELKEKDLKDGKSDILEGTLDIDELRNKILLTETEKDVEETTQKIINYVNNKDKKEVVSDVKEESNSKQCTNCRYYDPMLPNKPDYISKNGKAPICTSLNQKQLVKPIFTNDKMNFQGTDINEDTSVGTIMPKFIFHEYIEKDE